MVPIAWAAACRGEGLPAARDVPYRGTLALHVDATEVDHEVVQVRETVPAQAGRLMLLFPLWMPGEHAPTNEVKRLAGLEIAATTVRDPGSAIPIIRRRSRSTCRPACSRWY